MESRTADNPFENGKLIPVYFRLSLPVVLSSIVTIVYNLADTYFIAQTGDELLVAGVSVCAPVFMILMALGNIFGQGGSSLLSRLLGGKQMDDAKSVSAFCFWIALLTGFVTGGLLLMLREPFLRLLGASDSVLPHARAYGTVLLAGAPLIVVNFIHMNLLRCEGMASHSMIGTLIGAVVNIILDPLMIPSMGAAGAALATVIGYCCADAFLLIVVIRRSRSISVRPVLHIKAAFVKSILSIGITAAITNIATSLCTILMNQLLAGYGDDRIAAMGIVLKVTMITQMILVGFAFGGIPFIGYLHGSGRRSDIRKLIRFCLCFLSATALILTVFLFLAGAPVLRLITPDPAMIEIGLPMLRWQTAGSLFAGIVLLTTCLCQASGYAFPALALSLSRQGVVYVAVLLAASALWRYSGILAAQCISDVLSAVLALFILRRRLGSS